MTTDAFTALPGVTFAEKLSSIGIASGMTVDLRRLAAVSVKYGVAVYLFFERDLAYGEPLDQVINRFRDVPEEMRPYIRVENFLRFVQENDPVFAQVMQESPVMVAIVRVDQLAANPEIPPLVYVTGLMPFLEDLKM